MPAHSPPDATVAPAHPPPHAGVPAHAVVRLVPPDAHAGGTTHARFDCCARGDCCAHGVRLRMRPLPAPANVAT